MHNCHANEPFVDLTARPASPRFPRLTRCRQCRQLRRTALPVRRACDLRVPEHAATRPSTGRSRRRRRNAAIAGRTLRSVCRPPGNQPHDATRRCCAPAVGQVGQLGRQALALGTRLGVARLRSRSRSLHLDFIEIALARHCSRRRGRVVMRAEELAAWFDEARSRRFSSQLASKSRNGRLWCQAVTWAHAHARQKRNLMGFT